LELSGGNRPMEMVDLREHVEANGLLECNFELKKRRNQ